jgi:hypothetical protein
VSTHKKNSILNEPPRIRGVVVFALVISGLIFFRGIYDLEIKSHSLGTFVLPAFADVPSGGSEGGGEDVTAEDEDEEDECESESEAGACEAEAGEGEGEGEGGGEGF